AATARRAPGSIAVARARRRPSEGVQFLESTPMRLLTLYLPLGLIMLFLLFPFYWMTTTTFKPDTELYDYKTYNPLWVVHPTLDHIISLFTDTDYPSWWLNTMLVTVGATAVSLVASVCCA